MKPKKWVPWVVRIGSVALVSVFTGQITLANIANQPAKKTSGYQDSQQGQAGNRDNRSSNNNRNSGDGSANDGSSFGETTPSPYGNNDGFNSGDSGQSPYGNGNGVNFGDSSQSPGIQLPQQGGNSRSHTRSGGS